MNHVTLVAFLLVVMVGSISALVLPNRQELVEVNAKAKLAKLALANAELHNDERFFLNWLFGRNTRTPAAAQTTTAPAAGVTTAAAGDVTMCTAADGASTAAAAETTTAAAADTTAAAADTTAAAAATTV